MGIFASLLAAGLVWAFPLIAFVPLVASALAAFASFTGVPVHTLRGILFGEPTNACAQKNPMEGPYLSSQIGPLNALNRLRFFLTKIGPLVAPVWLRTACQLVKHGAKRGVSRGFNRGAVTWMESLVAAPV